MEYMFILFEDESKADFSPEAMAKWDKFGTDAEKIAKQVSGGALQPGATATVVASRDGNTVLTDGPFIDSKEGLAGYYVFDCDNLDVALELAKQIPIAWTGHVEVRPLVDFSAMMK